MPPTVSQDTTELVWEPTLGSLGNPGSGKIKKIADFTHFRGPEKNTSARTQKSTKTQKKLKMRKKEAASSKNFAMDDMTNHLRLTDEQRNFQFWIDGPEIWPSQKSKIFPEGGAGVALASPPRPIISV